MDGKAYVIVEKGEFDRLRERRLPTLPAADADGHFPAVAYARASLARKIVRDRTNAGLTQKELAKKAGIRVETLCRVETGKHTPSLATLHKIDRALNAAPVKRQRA
ncbi:MAG: helix-turn-helix domain-containing protein [Gemmataceae bacterium]|nr:helix-turn-helix domain-containing protein [Gemmataceae bacterium]